MLIHIFPLTCQACGEKGMGDHRAVVGAWTENGVVTHKDPQVCIENLRRKLKSARSSHSSSGKVIIDFAYDGNAVGPGLGLVVSNFADPDPESLSSTIDGLDSYLDEIF